MIILYGGIFMNEMTLSMKNILEIGTGFTKSGLVLTVVFAIVIFP